MLGSGLGSCGVIVCLTSRSFRCAGSSHVYLYGSLSRAMSGVEIAPRGCHVGGCFSMLFILRANAQKECRSVSLLQTATESQPPTFSKDHSEVAKQEFGLFDSKVEEWLQHPLAVHHAWKTLRMPCMPLGQSLCPSILFLVLP